MLGSWLFRYMTIADTSVEWISRILQICVSVMASCLLITVLSGAEYIRFYAFSIFELCIGLYFPSMAFLKSRVVADSHRGTIYGLMRLPLNIFVISILYTIKDGTSLRSLGLNMLADNGQAMSTVKADS